MEVYIDLLCFVLAWHGVSAQMDNGFNITMKADPMTITPVITKLISLTCAVPNTGNRTFRQISNIALVIKGNEWEDDRYLAGIYNGEEARIPDGSIFQGQEVKGNILKHDDRTNTGYLNLTIHYPTKEEINTNVDGTVCKVTGLEKIDATRTESVEEYVSVQVATVNATFQSLGGVFNVVPLDIVYPFTDTLSVKCSINGTNTFENVSSIAIEKDGVDVIDTNNTQKLPNATIASKLTGSVGYLKATVKYPKGVLGGSFECVIQVDNAEGTKLIVTSASLDVNHTNPSFADLTEFVHKLDLRANALDVQNVTTTSDITTMKGDIASLKQVQNRKFYVRLVGGDQTSNKPKRYGTPEVSYQGFQGPICDDVFNINAANVVCRMLGWDGAISSKSNNFYNYKHQQTSGSREYILDNVNCKGTETNLDECGHNDVYSNDCSANEVAGVECRNVRLPLGK